MLAERKKAKKARDRERATYFCIGYSTIWGEPLHKELKRLRDKHGLTWLRIAMSYHKFSNLGEKLTSLTAQIHVYFGDVTWEQSHATTHIGQILLGVSHTQLDSAHNSALLTAQHMTHRRFTLASAFELKHKHQTDLCATSIVDDETKTMHVHATQQYKVHNNITRTI
jgi:hypothetical protein